ncbi:D-alanine--D-alanine ligase family protein [Luteitalea sp.]|uniref:D-alanine--D-alanine ligase family protein n=1 Tax=Luteitalea sp. TaxID=2004800 RepID=UPI0025C27826|nr:D-alanine--D-alanine ligase family protein [Luteitalea sp.]
MGVIYGGRSGEHEVSIASAAAVMANLDRARYEPVPIRIDRDGRWSLADKPPTAASASEVIEQTRSEMKALRAGREVHLLPRPSEETILAIDRTPTRGEDEPRAIVTGVGLDVIFPVLHGPHGEDGTVQGLLELANVPYVGCGVLASSVGMDKALMKRVFAAHGLPQCAYAVVLRRRVLAETEVVADELLAQLGLPLFVKPANLGSSVGISKARTRDELVEALKLAADYDRKVVVEAGVPAAREIEVAVLGNDEPIASVPGEIVPSREFYDYEAKYLDGASRLAIPADVPDEMGSRLQALAIAAFRAVDGAGLSRVDFLVDGDSGEVFVNEINTMPGFTTISMYSKLWAATGLAYPELVDRLVQLALERHAEKQQLRVSAF